MSIRAECDNCGAVYELDEPAAEDPPECRCGNTLRVTGDNRAAPETGNDGPRQPLDFDEGGGGGMLQLKSRLEMPESVPMTTMADVAFLLIIFFLLTSTFAKDAGLDVSLPKAMTSKRLPKRKITVWVTSGGRIKVNDTWIKPENLSDALSSQLEQTSLKAVTIRGDEGVPYGTIVAVMDTVKRLGARITLAAEVEEAAPSAEAGTAGAGGGE